MDTIQSKIQHATSGQCILNGNLSDMRAMHNMIK